MATTVLNLNFGRKVNKIINQWLLRENATSQSHETLAETFVDRIE